MTENKWLRPLQTMVFLAVCFLTSCTSPLLPDMGLDGLSRGVSLDRLDGFDAMLMKTPMNAIEFLFTPSLA